MRWCSPAASASTRRKSARGSAPPPTWLGIGIDAKANAAGGPRISGKDSAVAVLALATNEELMIARHVRAVLRQPAAAAAS